MSIRLRLSRFMLVLCIILPLTVGLMVFTSGQGPRLRRGEYHLRSAARELPQIILKFNQPVAWVEQEQVSISPELSYAVTTANDTVTIELFERPEPGDNHRITVQLRSKYGGQRSTVQFEFRAPIILF